MAAGLASLPGDAMANPVYTFDNLASAQIAGDRVNNVGRGMAQAFVVNASSSLASAVFGIYNLNGTTGTLNAALYSVNGSSTASYSIGSQIGSTASLSAFSLPTSAAYTTIDVSALQWDVISGNNYAVALWSGSNWNNPDGGGGGIYWVGGISTPDNRTRFNNWNALAPDPWENWGNTTTGFSLGLVSVQAVPEPSTYAMAIAGLACGGWQVFRRRRTRAV